MRIRTFVVPWYAWDWHPRIHGKGPKPWARWARKRGDYCETLGKRGCNVGWQRPTGRTHSHYHWPAYEALPRPWKLSR